MYHMTWNESSRVFCALGTKHTLNNRKTRVQAYHQYEERVEYIQCLFSGIEDSQTHRLMDELSQTINSHHMILAIDPS